MPNGAISIIREYSDGKLYRFNGYNAYVPNDYNENTPIMYYLCGDGGTDAYEAPFTISAHGNFHKRFSEGNAESIVIQVPRNVVFDYNTKARTCYVSGTQANIYVADIKKNLGITGNMIVSISHSGSAVDASQAALSLLGSAPESQPPIVHAVMDGNIPVYNWQSNGYIEKFKQNHSIFLLFAQNQDTSTAKSYYGNYLELAKQGVNTIIFEDDKSINGRPRYHIEMSDAFTELGIYDYLSGNGTIDFSKFKSIRAFINGTEINLDLSQVDSVKKLYSFFGIDGTKYHVGGSLSNLELANLKNFSLLSDKGNLSSYLNKIRTSVRKTAYLTANLSAYSCSSTTQVPSQINSCVSNYLNNVTSTLNNIVSLTDSIAQIHESYVDTDKKLEKEINKTSK